MRPLGDEIENTTSYADDTYGMIEMDNCDNMSVAADKILDHLKWLRNSGMIVNDLKTEIMIMHKNNRLLKDFQIGEINIKSKNNMNVLGVLFNQNLKWSDHVEKNLNSCQRVLHGLKVVRKYFTIEKFLQILTSFLFSKLFYSCEIWSYDILSFECKRKIDSFYYKACRVALNDFENTMSRPDINNIVKRATPEEFSKYACARTVINSYNAENGSIIQSICNKTKYSINRKTGRYFFYDSSRCKVEKNSIENRIDHIFKEIDFPWLNLTFDKIRPRLKNVLFNYKS